MQILVVWVRERVSFVSKQILVVWVRVRGVSFCSKQVLVRWVRVGIMVIFYFPVFRFFIFQFL